MYSVKLTPTAGLMFRNLHPTIRKQLKSILKESYQNPHLGKKLQNELADFRSLKMKRYRAIYQIDNHKKEVIIYAIGHRRNIYEILT
ncbi:MAG: type II toxin-antitoxin system RelE/ParE family toxin [Desulfobacula sp.]|uniref:type II toxin-antitoxin system RelE family toxin n=1 Tax=Desulfobacula sp. TaxID=2593537 RepID=UPI002A022CD3|nr:type II toxin-antitoxin system RelE/ParE family toxin [Chloroflexota bacterium]MBT6751456.1 type II toxin-antitoxin system RelE/ParE family toxin [Desulfobacula sp.]